MDPMIAHCRLTLLNWRIAEKAKANQQSQIDNPNAQPPNARGNDPHSQTEYPQMLVLRLRRHCFKLPNPSFVGRAERLNSSNA